MPREGDGAKSFGRSRTRDRTQDMKAAPPPQGGRGPPPSQGGRGPTSAQGGRGPPAQGGRGGMDSNPNRGGHERGAPNVNFTVQVPFDIAEGMPCRAMYYGDEMFYDAVTVKKTRNGWYVRFVGFEDEDPQDTEVADILSVPFSGQPGQNLRPRGPLNPTAPEFVSPAGGGATPRGRGPNAPNAPVPPRSNNSNQEAAANQGRVRKCRYGAACTIYACGFEHPESREIDSATWDPCEALFYDEGVFYGGFRGPKTGKGYLVSFINFELEPCQDTLEKDIRMTEKGGRARAKKDKAGPSAVEVPETKRNGRGGKAEGAAASPNEASKKPNQKQQPQLQQPQQQQPKKQGRKGQDAHQPSKDGHVHQGAGAGELTRSSRVPNDCVVIAKGLDAEVTRMDVLTFCSKIVGCTPASVRMLKRFIKPDASGTDSAPGRCLLIFESPKEVDEFIQRSRGLRLKGKKPIFTLKTESGAGGASEIEAAGAQDEFEEEEDEAKVQRRNSQLQGELHHGQELQLQMGTLYDALLGGSLLADGTANEGGSEEVELTFGICMTPLVKASMHVLRQDGESYNSGSLGANKVRVKDKKVAVAVPTSWTFVKLAQFKDELIAALPTLDPKRVTLLDVMTAAAVEFVDGWYSNMYDTNSMSLILVNIEAKSTQLGLVNVSPTHADMVTIMSTDKCSEEILLQEATALLAGKIEEQVKHTYNFEAEQWWPQGHGVLNDVARKMVEEVGSKGECWMPVTYCPPGRDAALMVDVRVSAAELQSGDGKKAIGAAMLLAQQLMQAAAKADAAPPSPTGPSSNIAPVGGSWCGEALCRALFPLVGATRDSLHMFLRDPRNLAAGAARAALWLAEEPAERAGGSSPLPCKRVVRRCMHPYGCAVVHSTDENTLGMTEIPWVSKGRELPVKCTVNDLDMSGKKFVVFVGGPIESRDILATVELGDDCDEVVITINKDGMLEANRFCKQEPVDSSVKLSSLKELKEAPTTLAQMTMEHQADLTLVFEVLRPIFEAT